MKPWSIFRSLALFVCCAAGLRAQSSTWTGLGLTDIEWSDNLNWDTPPTTSSNVFFSGITPVISDIDSNTTIGNLYIEGSILGTLDLTSTGGYTLNAGIYYETPLAATISVAVVNPGLAIYANGGTLTLANGSNMLGGLTVLAGTVIDSVPGAYSTTTGVQIDGPGVLDVNFNESAGYLSDYSTGGGSVVLASGVTLALANNYSTTFSGVVSGPGNLVKGANSTMTLTGANTYTGTTVIGSGAAIQLGNGGTTGSLSASTVVSGGGGLGFYLTGTPAPVQEAITGAIQVVLHSGSGTVKLSGNNTYSGGTVVNGGTLQAGSASAFGGTAYSVATIAAGANLDLNGFSNTTGGIAGSGNVLLTGSGTNLTIGGSTAEIFTGTVTGPGGLVMDGFSQYLSGNGNTYSGNTTINGGSLVADNTLNTASATGAGFIVIGSSGTLQIGSGDTNGYVSGSVTDNGKVSFFRSDTNTFANNINGSGGIEMAGFATQVLSGSNGYSGETEMFRGTLQAGGGDTSAFGSGSAFVFDGVGSTLDLNNNNELLGSISGGSSSDHITLGSGNMSVNDTLAMTTYGGDISGSGGLTTREAKLTLTANNTYVGQTSILAGTLVADNHSGSATGTGDIQIAGGASLYIGNDVTPDTYGSVSAPLILDDGTLFLSRTDATVLTSQITGTGGVTLVGSESATLTGSNTYSGATKILSNGSLYVGSSSSLGNGSGALTIDNGGIMVMQGFNLSFGSLIGDTSGQIQTGGATLTIGSSGASTGFGGSIEGTGGIVKAGTGTQTLSGFNSYSGTTQVEQGVLVDGATDSLSPNSVVYVGGSQGGSLTVNHDESIAGLGDYLGLPGTVTVNGSSNLTITGTSYFGSVISGSGGVAVDAPASIVTMGGANNYHGDTSITQGTLEDGGTNVFSSQSALKLFTGGSVVANNAQTIANVEGTGGTLTLNSTLTSLGSNYIEDYQGVLTGTGMFVVGGGVQGLSGNNTYGGGTLVTGAGELFVGSDTALGTGTATFDTGTEFSPDASVTLANNIILENGEDLDNDDGSTNNMTLNGVISETGGVGSIQWCTLGTLTLNGANTFTGGVDMREGNLVLGNNSAAGTGTITLNTVSSLNVMTGVTTTNPLNITGASVTLTGSGTIATPVVANSVVVISPVASPGNGPGNLTFSAGLTLDTGSTLQFNIFDATGAAGTGYSLISTTGGFSLIASTSTITLNIDSIDSMGNAAQAIHFNAGSPYSWTFATSSTAISGFTASQFVIDTSGFQNSIGAGYFSVSESANNLLLNFTPVPEPSTWCLLGAGVLAVVPIALRRPRSART